MTDHAAPIRLSEGGGFRTEIRGLCVELSYDPQNGSDPWCVSVVDPEGLCLRLEGVADLDAGLDRLAELGEATRSGLRDLYRVVLPDGSSFLRPGRVAAETLLARHGYDLVGAARAFLVAPLDGALGREDAFLWFADRLGVLAPLLVSVDLADTDGETNYWCADALLPANGFYRPDGLLAFARGCVGACGVEMFSEIGVRAAAAQGREAGAVLAFARRTG